MTKPSPSFSHGLSPIGIHTATGLRNSRAVVKALTRPVQSVDWHRLAAGLIVSLGMVLACANLPSYAASRAAGEPDPSMDELARCPGGANFDGFAFTLASDRLFDIFTGGRNVPSQYCARFAVLSKGMMASSKLGTQIQESGRSGLELTGLSSAEKEARVNDAVRGMLAWSLSAARTVSVENPSSEQLTAAAKQLDSAKSIYLSIANELSGRGRIGDCDEIKTNPALSRAYRLIYVPAALVNLRLGKSEQAHNLGPSEGAEDLIEKAQGLTNGSTTMFKELKRGTAFWRDEAECWAKIVVIECELSRRPDRQGLESRADLASTPGADSTLFLTSLGSIYCQLYRLERQIEDTPEKKVPIPIPPARRRTDGCRRPGYVYFAEDERIFDANCDGYIDSGEISAVRSRFEAVFPPEELRRIHKLLQAVHSKLKSVDTLQEQRMRLDAFLTEVVSGKDVKEIVGENAEKVPNRGAAWWFGNRGCPRLYYDIRESLQDFVERERADGTGPEGPEMVRYVNRLQKEDGTFVEVKWNGDADFAALFPPTVVPR